MLPACLFTLKQKKSGYALRYKKLSFNKCWTQEHGMTKLFLSYKYCFGVISLGSKINRSVGQPAASAEAERLVLSFRNP